MYCNLIRDQIRKRATHIATNNFIFQRDNATAHTAKIVQEYFSVLDWSARSPDLNIIGNCWDEFVAEI